MKRMATEEEEPADPLRRHVAQVQQYQATARLLQDASVAHNRALRYVTDLKATPLFSVEPSRQRPEGANRGAGYHLPTSA